MIKKVNKTSNKNVFLHQAEMTTTLKMKADEQKTEKNKKSFFRKFEFFFRGHFESIGPSKLLPFYLEFSRRKDLIVFKN